MSNESKQEFDTHLAEYSALRGEIVQYNQRIDRTVGVYLSALVGLSGYLLRPDSEFRIAEYIGNVVASQSQSNLMLILGILNSLLLLRLQSFFLAVLAMSQYTATVIRPRLVILLNTDSVLRWDEGDTVRAKKYWLPSRSVSQFGFGTVALLISIGAGIIGVTQAMLSVFTLGLLLVLLAFIAYSIFTSIRIVQAGINFLEAPVCSVKKPNPKHNKRSAEGGDV